MSISERRRYRFSISTLHRQFAALLLVVSFSAFAWTTQDVPPDHPSRDTVERLEGLSCVPHLSRVLGPTAYGDLRAALLAEMPEEDQKRCRVPRWLVLERDLALRPQRPNYGTFSALVLGDEAVALSGLEATVTPSLPLRGGRPVFRGPNLYSQLSVGIEAGYDQGWGLALGISPGLVFALDDYHTAVGRAFLQEAYAKLGYKGFELTFGRVPITFGNAKHGSLLLSPAMKPLDVMKFDVRPRRTFLGQLAFQLWLSNFTEAAAVPEARLFGVGLTVAPAEWLELSILHVAQSGGQGVPAPSLGDFAKMLLYLDDTDLATRRQRGLAAQVALWAPSNRFQLYGQLYIDDYASGVSPLLGLWVPRLGSFDLRVEYVSTAQDAYRHPVWKQGLVYRGTPVGHPLGSDGEGLYADLGLLSLGNWRPTAVFAYERRQRTPGAGVATESRIGGGLDLVHRWAVMELVAAARLFSVTNFRYVPGNDTTVASATVAIRYSFL